MEHDFGDETMLLHIFGLFQSHEVSIGPRFLCGEVALLLWLGLGG